MLALCKATCRVYPAKGNYGSHTAFLSSGSSRSTCEALMEHRWGHRYEVSRPVRLGTRGGVMARGKICNVSISGAFIVSPLPVALFAHIQVQFRAMVDGRRTSTTVEGQVVRKDTMGLGSEWSDFATEGGRA